MEQFLGQILMVGFNFAPTGWALCNGQLLPISQNTALFSLLGTMYGGDGVSTFALPDLRGRVPIHFGESAGLSDYIIGEKAGTETTTLAVNNLPAHNHSVNVATIPGDVKNPASHTFGMLSTSDYLYSDTAPTHKMAAGTISSTGSGTPFSNLQPFLCVNFIIALQGIFPARS